MHELLIEEILKALTQQCVASCGIDSSVAITISSACPDHDRCRAPQRGSREPHPSGGPRTREYPSKQHQILLTCITEADPDRGREPGESPGLTRSGDGDKPANKPLGKPGKATGEADPKSEHHSFLTGIRIEPRVRARGTRRGLVPTLKAVRTVTKRITAVLALLIMAVTALSVVYSVHIGSEPLDGAAVWDVLRARLGGGGSEHKPVEVIVWELRLPRALLSVIIGAGLGIAGCGMQTLVRNPLADPYLLGVSAGASVGATAVITFGIFSGFGLWAISVGALLGALAAALTVYLVAIAQGGLTPIRLVLSGVVLSSAFSAVASFLVFKGPDPRAAQSVLFWLLGSLSGAQWDRLALPLAVVTLCLLLLLAGHNWLDALAWGPDAAAALGVPVKHVRQGLFLILAILVGALVAVSGSIGFVGLVIPHLCRIVVGSLHRHLLPVAAASGGLFLLWVDVASRVIVAPAEVPLGVVTGLIGAPVFLIIMRRRSYGFGGNS